MAGLPITAEGVTKSFAGGPVIEPFHVTIQPGAVVSVIGPSGCGKSTLLRIIAGLETADHGSVDLGSEPSAQARRHKRVAIVPQQPGLLPWRTTRANAELLVQLNRRVGGATHSVDALLDEVGLTDAADRYPHQLSGGMQQRVALVRALALDAPVLLLDEPFAALDEITRTDMRELVQRLVTPRGITTVLVTHSISEAVAISDRVLVVSPRPMRVVADVPVELPRPRGRLIDDDPRFVHAAAEVRRALHASMAAEGGAA